MTLHIQNKLMQTLLGKAETLKIEEVRIGVGYSAVKLDNGHAGLAWTPPNRGGGCTHLHAAGTLGGKPATELLAGLVEERPLLRALGVATANALLADSPSPDVSTVNALEPLRITPSCHVVMVGYFGPLVRDLQNVGCRLDIVELDSNRPGVLSPQQGQKVLGVCDVAILTGTSLITGTLDELFASLGRPRSAVLLGPSAPLCAEVFADTPLTQISGARVLDCDSVFRVISEGGGTPLLKRHVAFETLLFNAVPACGACR
ncbi:protein of unknown function DUF364 [Syntrophotalea carbinolica DSM 2380]|uniref:Heavy-metal chelation domain-containing protein n=1 Tax=Syntrophotalea carbinolica (strain DSM 2380 / NBRC 103641 / GraBd1) TaxID=338963 RepID=Q3A341_SYNC1|nr:DUF364 domain-containing protein [Syntrophotalea carbinolica]ABA89216.1 protein of unknown function DUF364 [Syntrophotalea carbinolica DSM 2380]